VRGRPDPGIVRESHPPPPQPRLNPGGDRQANHALRRILLTWMSAHPPTLIYVERRTEEGLSKKEIIRCLKRYVAARSTATSAPTADAHAPGTA
jgi:hypothetical protein